MKMIILMGIVDKALCPRNVRAVTLLGQNWSWTARKPSLNTDNAALGATIRIQLPIQQCPHINQDVGAAFLRPSI